MKIKTIAAAVLAGVILLAAGCSSNPKVTRVDADTQMDLSGYWNDTDVRIVCESLINDCLNSPRVAQASAQKRALPVIIVGRFRNDSDEHIDTTIISSRMEIAILNSGLADFVAAGDTRDDIRDERQQQQSWSSEETAKALANETGADFYLSGSVKTIIDQAGKTSTRTYFVSAELTDIESNRRIWIGQDDSIKKVIKTPGAKL
ncbi:penicillin-binding protein activator LpoB [Breznakiella homolactica]|uniref:penicillin-binding protein activator LpoB n=1 Tax=Breznakiella homolactica TaxID=2798577 RepID=UPI0032DEE34E